MDRERTGAGPLTWALRLVLVVAALAAPIITFKAFTDIDEPDPERQQRLRDVRDESIRSPANSGATTREAVQEPRP